MAFGFIEALPAIGKLFSAGAGIYSLFDQPDPYKDNPYLQSMVNQAELSRLYGEAAVNPENPWARNLSAVLYEQDRKNIIGDMMTAMLANRRALRRGDIGLSINPERRDESRYRAILEAFDLARTRAKETASTRLTTAASTAQQNMAAYQSLASIFGGYAGEARKQRMGGFEAIGGAIGGLGPILGQIFGQRAPQAGGTLPTPTEPTTPSRPVMQSQLPGPLARGVQSVPSQYRDPRMFSEFRFR